MSCTTLEIKEFHEDLNIILHLIGRCLTERQGKGPCVQTQEEKESNGDVGFHSGSVTILFLSFVMH